MSSVVSDSPITIEGKISNSSGLPLQNVSVKAGNKETTTDLNGGFKVTNAVFSTDEKFVIASLPGYFNGSRTIYPNTNTNNYIEISLAPRSEVATINTSSGGIASFNNASVSFPANAFETQSGSVYTGTVSVKAMYLDPENPHLAQLMPGDLRGNTLSGELRGLQTFGMINVELEGNAGEKLKLKPGVAATINMPIPTGMLTISPANIPLWYFDESAGLWKEEGNAQKSGNSYIGDVSHFTIWNCDMPYNYVLVEGRLLNASLAPLGGMFVKMTSLADSACTYDLTDNGGYLNGFIQANVPIRIDIYSQCGSLLYSSLTGPFSSNTVLPDISISSLIDCVNTLAGNYTMTGSRYNYTGTVSYSGPTDPIPPGVETPYSGIVVALPVSGQTVQMDMGNVPDPAGSIAQYFITGTDPAFSNITYAFSSTFMSGYSNIHTYVVSYTSPNPGPVSFHLITQYTNGAGNDRIIDQTFIHQ